MPTNRDPQVKKNLQATAELLDALQDNPTLLNDEEFMKRLAILREKHEETTNFLAKKIGAPPLPTVIMSSKTMESKTVQSSSKVHMTTSTSCHQRYLDDVESFPRRLDLNEDLKEDVREESEYHTLHRHNSESVKERAYSGGPRHQVPEVSRVHTSPPKIRVPIRIAPAPPQRQRSLEQQENLRMPSGIPREEHLNLRDSRKASGYQQLQDSSQNKITSSSGASRQSSSLIQNNQDSSNFRAATMTSGMPRHQNYRDSRSSSISRRLHRQHSAGARHQRNPTSTSTSNVREILANAHSKHQLPTSSIAMASGLLLSSSNTKHIPRHPPQFATTSDVVEESFLEDGMSTTREVPTIVDEIVVDPKRKLKINGSILSQKHRSKSMHNVSDPQVTIPRPFQLSLRKSTGNTYAKKFMSDLMTEKQKQEEETLKELEGRTFKAKPVPKSTYLPTNTFATEQKYIEAMRKKVTAVAKKKFEAQNEMFRSKSEGNLASIKPLGYVPPSTYISPIPVRPNARNRSATTRSAIMIQEALTPKGIKSHRNQSNLTHNLRHGRCKLDTSAVVLHRRTSPPDFNKIHAKINEEYRRFNSKPSTVPMPFKFAKRSQSATSRHTNCREKSPEPFKPSAKTQDFGKNSQNNVPTTQATRLREELVRNKLQKEKAENAEKNSLWAEDNRKRIASFLGARSKTDENIAMLTRRRIQQQHETEQDYMRQLSEMKQRVLNGPLIMEKQTALAQEHRLKRKFEQRMKSAKAASRAPLKKQSSSRRASETSAAGTFVVEKEDGYEDDFESKGGSGSGKSSEDSTSSESEASAKSSPVKESGSSEDSSKKSSSSESSSEEESSEEEDESPR